MDLTFDLWFLEAFFFNLVLGKNYNRDTTHAASSTSSSTHASVHAYAKHAPVKQLVNSKLSSTAHHSSSPPPIKSSHSSSTLLSQGQLLQSCKIVTKIITKIVISRIAKIAILRNFAIHFTTLSYKLIFMTVTVYLP